MKRLRWLLLSTIVVLTGLLERGEVRSQPSLKNSNSLPITKINSAAERTRLNRIEERDLKYSSIGKVGEKSGKQPEAPKAESENYVELQNLEQQAQQLYEAGRLTEAVQVLQRLIKDYDSRSDELGSAMALRNMSLVYQKLGDWSSSERAIADSLKLLEKVAPSRDRARLLALTLESQGQLQLSLGQSEQALDSWKKAAKIYDEINDVRGVTKSRINQAQALQVLGLYTQALKTLTEVQKSLDEQADSLYKARGLQSLGDALRVVGRLERSEEVLRQSLAIAETIQESEARAATLLSLGNTLRVRLKPDLALQFYQRAVSEAPSLNTKIEAQLNQLSLLVDRKQDSSARALVPEIESNLQNVSASQTAVYARINLARSLMKMSGNRSHSDLSSLAKADLGAANDAQLSAKAAELLASAVQQARTIKDQRALSYALGNMAGLYEQNKQWEYARKMSEEALLLAQAMNAADIAYQWQWQLGRVLKVQGKREAAIASYSQAVKTLQSLRSDLVAISSDVQFSFRENVEPVYRELVGLLLQPGANVEQSDLIEARRVIESLQLAELDNFFRDACLNTKPVQIDQIDATAAVFYTIILSDRLEVIAALPGQPLRHYTTTLPQEEIEQTLSDMRNAVVTPRLRLSLKRFLDPSQQVYDWLIRPIEADLASKGVKNLVFILDGSLRNIPLNALYDGKQYLAQKYSVALAPGLQLVEPKPLARESFKILTAGLTEARQGFSALPNVELEVQRIKSEVPTQVLLNQAFTETNFKNAFKTAPFPVVHLATHGEFSSEAKDTFILTWDGKLNANELDRLLRSDSGQNRSIELLVLSACKTAAGDKRAALGLAGVAVRAGARSTLASLWYVSDEATSMLMTKFYEELSKGNVGKSEALRLAQQSIMQSEKFSHPYYWSAFVLVGNWL